MLLLTTHDLVLPGQHRPTDAPLEQWWRKTSWSLTFEESTFRQIATLDENLTPDFMSAATMSFVAGGEVINHDSFSFTPGTVFSIYQTPWMAIITQHDPRTRTWLCVLSLNSHFHFLTEFLWNHWRYDRRKNIWSTRSIFRLKYFDIFIACLLWHKSAEGNITYHLLLRKMEKWN